MTRAAVGLPPLYPFNGVSQLADRALRTPPAEKTAICHGFDCNSRVLADQARRMRDAGYRFAGRYVRREQAHTFDLTTAEVVTLLDAGLGITIFQHVAKTGWMPSGRLGESYGAIAAEESRQLGIPPNVVLWCDLEGVSISAPTQAVIDFSNAWFDAVKAAHYDPGIYLGWRSGITGYDAYYKLKFRRYCAAYNLNRDAYPAERGVCMQQSAFPKEPLRVPGIPWEYDTQFVMHDNFNNLPAMLLPKDPG
jgi:hypothetical protein